MADPNTTNLEDIIFENLEKAGLVEETDNSLIPGIIAGIVTLSTIQLVWGIFHTSTAERDKKVDKFINDIDEFCKFHTKRSPDSLSRKPEKQRGL